MHPGHRAAKARPLRALSRIVADGEKNVRQRARLAGPVRPLRQRGEAQHELYGAHGVAAAREEPHGRLRRRPRVNEDR